MLTFKVANTSYHFPIYVGMISDQFYYTEIYLAFTHVNHLQASWQIKKGTVII